jgi:hypothetical protein
MREGHSPAALDRVYPRDQLLDDVDKTNVRDRMLGLRQGKSP